MIEVSLLEYDKNIVGQRLKELRKKREESQETTANNIGISRARYSHYENNHVEPDIEMIIKLAEYFEVDTDYLLGRSNITTVDYIWIDSFIEMKSIFESLK